jgi:hypothetical protein
MAPAGIECLQGRLLVDELRLSVGWAPRAVPSRGRERCRSLVLQLLSQTPPNASSKAAPLRRLALLSCAVLRFAETRVLWLFGSATGQLAPDCVGRASLRSGDLSRQRQVRLGGSACSLVAQWQDVRLHSLLTSLPRRECERSPFGSPQAAIGSGSRVER